MNFKGHVDERILDCIHKLICSEYQYWGEFSLFVNFQESKQVPTCGVTIKNCNPLYYYNQKFIDGLSNEELMFVHLHELFHLICDDCQRTKNRQKKLSNVAQDMIINDSVREHLGSSKFVKVPKISLAFVPKEYEGDKIFEPLYTWLSEEYEKWKKKNPDKANRKIKINVDPNGNMSPEKEKGDGNKEDGEGEGKPDKQEGEGEPDKQKGEGKGQGKEEATLDEIFEGLEDYEFDVHFDETIDTELRKQIIDDILNNLKNRGFETESIKKMLERLQKSKKNYLKDIIRSISMIKGCIKRKSFKRPSRKGIPGLKGKVKYCSALNVVLDTSGSMNGYFEKILSVIFRDDIVINLIQCDTEVKCVEEIKSKRDLQRMMIKGLGGTIIQPGIDKVIEKYNKLNTVILTDGCTDDLDVRKLRRCLIISTHVLPKVTGNFKGVIIKDGME